MARTMDTRPVPGDKGMEDKERPTMNAFGVFLRREVLQPMGAAHRPNFDNDTITLYSVKDFVQLARWYSAQTKSRRLPVTLGEEDLTWIASRRGESIRLRLAGDAVRVLLTKARGSFQQEGGQLWFDTTSPINIQAVLRALAALDAELPR